MNVLIEIQDGISVCYINGRDYPVARVEDDYIAITVSRERLADDIVLRVNGEKNPTSSRYTPFEVWVTKDKFDKICRAKNWAEVAQKLE